MIDTRFAGIVRLYGMPTFERLQKAHVAVVGLGGVGSWAAEALARTGVGELTLIDSDVLCISNTNRQLHALEANIGKPKAELMTERIQQINPHCKIHTVVEFVTRETMAELIHNDLDGVVDCIDSVVSKAALIAWCKRRKIQIVATGGAGGQTDPTQIRVTDLNKIYNDPLAAKVRSLLRRDYGFSKTAGRHYSIPCVSSIETSRHLTAQSAEGEAAKLVRFGTATMVTASFGMAAASKMVEKIAEGARRPSEKKQD